MSTNGKIEARITIPSGGWDFRIVESPLVTAVINVPAGTYYHSSIGDTGKTLSDEIKSQISASALAGTYSVSVSRGEGGDGKYTISCSGGGVVAFGLTWAGFDPEIGLLLGFPSSTTGGLSYTGPNQAQALWIASGGHQKKNGGSGGSARTSDQQVALNSSGYVFAVQGRSYRTAKIVWPMESRAKCWAINEATPNESFETFLLDGIWADAAWATVIGPIRFYSDADVDGTYGTFSAIGLGSWDPVELVEHFAGGRWRIELPQLIEVPS